MNFAVYKYAFQAVWRRPVKGSVAPLKRKSQSEPPFPNPNSEIPRSKHYCVLLYLLTAPRSLILFAVIVGELHPACTLNSTELIHLHLKALATLRLQRLRGLAPRGKGGCLQRRETIDGE